MTGVIDGRDFIDTMLATDTSSLSAAGTNTTQINFAIQRWVLQLLLEKAATVIPTRDAMPVLKNFQFDVRTNRLRVVASDVERSMIASTDIVTVASPGTAVFPARKMLDIVRESSDPDVRVRVNGLAASITIGRTTWNLMLAGGDDFPAMPEITEVTFAPVDRGAYITALNAVRYAACRDANRTPLMMIDVKRARMTTCDGGRFAQAPTADLPFDYQIPIGAVDDLLKLLRSSDLDEIHVGESEHRLIFRLGSDVFIANKLAAQFPDLEATWLRPALANKHELVVDRADLLAAVKRIRINADPTTSAIALILADNSLTVSARDKYHNDATETVTAEWSHGERTIVINHSFLTDMVTRYEAPTLRFYLGEDTKTRKSLVMLRDPDSGTVAATQQMNLDWVGA